MKKLLKKLRKNKLEINQHINFAEQIKNPPTVNFNMFRNVDDELAVIFNEVKQLKTQRIKLLKKLKLKISNQIIKYETN